MVNDVFAIVGTTLSGAFLVEEVMAEGGFGVVYRAEHIAFRAKVALKCLKIPASMTDAQKTEFVENFREEAEMLFHLSVQIPEVVRPLHADAVVLPSGILMPFIAMEWIDGTPLDSILVAREDEGKPPIGLTAAMRMLAPIARALERAHRFEVPGGAALSISHCDLKPENILILDHGSVRAKLLDFGIARAREYATSSVGRMTETDASRSFTPGYGAPEQWLPKSYGATGPWTDVWALALTLVECTTGRPPIDGDLQAMMGTTIDPNRRPTPRNEGAVVSDAVEEVFERALAVEPKRRYTDMRTFWGALERAVAAAGTGTPTRAEPGLETALELDLTPGPGPTAPAAERPASAPAPAAPRVAPPAPVADEAPLRIEMDDGAVSARAPASRPAAMQAAAAARPHVPRPAPAPVVSSQGKSGLLRAFTILGIGLAIVALDVVLKQPGAPLAIAGVRVRWIGAIAAGIGIVMALASLATSDDD